jgi:hypothetical protein
MTADLMGLFQEFAALCLEPETSENARAKNILILVHRLTFALST